MLVAAFSSHVVPLAAQKWHAVAPRGIAVVAGAADMSIDLRGSQGVLAGDR